MRNINKEKIYKELIDNECYFVFDCIDRKIKYAIYHDEVIYNNASLDSVLEDDYFMIDEESKKDIINFADAVEIDMSKSQVSFKATKNGISKWYMIEAFTRDDDRYISGSVKSIFNVMKDKDQLIELSMRDPLTGLFNRLATNKKINDLILNNSFFNMLLIDIDFFKDVNDTFGHTVGDLTIKGIADALSSIVGDNGFVSRFGGDEFLLLYKFNHAPTNDESRELCRRVREAVRTISVVKTMIASLTVTIGSVTYPFDGTSYGCLFDNVDKALYRGKSKGRDCYVIYITSLHQNIDVSNPHRIISSLGDSSVSITTFISDLLGSLLEMPTRARFESKFKDLAMFLHLERAMVISHTATEYKLEYVWAKDEENIIKEYFKVLDYNEYINLFKNDDTYVVNNILDEQYSGSPLKKAMDIGYTSGSIVQILCGRNNKMDLIFSFELLNNRRIWTREEIMCLKISSKILANFYKE